jgi:hypothetical protein
MKVWIVAEMDNQSRFPVMFSSIIKVFSNEKAANDFMENIGPGAYRYYMVEEHEVVDDGTPPQKSAKNRAQKNRQ